MHLVRTPKKAERGGKSWKATWKATCDHWFDTMHHGDFSPTSTHYPLRKLMSCAIHWCVKGSWRFCFVQVGKADESDFTFWTVPREVNIHQRKWIPHWSSIWTRQQSALSQSWRPAQAATSASFLLYSFFLLHLNSLSQQAKKRKEHNFPPTALVRRINRFFADCTAAAALGELNSETGSAAAAAAATSDRTLTGQMRCSSLIFNSHVITAQKESVHLGVRD